MIHHKGKLIFLLFFSQLLLNAQKNFHVEVNGNNIISTNEIMMISKSHNFTNDTTASKIKLKKEILARYSDEGYFNAEVQIRIFQIDSTTIDVNLDINEQQPSLINNIFIINSDSVDNAGNEDVFYFLKGRTFNRVELEKTIHDLLSEYEKSGYPFASIKIENMIFNYDSVQNKSYCDLYLRFLKNDKSMIDKIVIEGNTKTKDYVIKRNIRIKEGDEFNASKINKIPEILNRIKFFEPVRSAQYYFDQNKNGVLNIIVAEKNTNNFDGILGYVPSINKKERGFFTGFVNFNFRNLFGTERMLLFKWQKDERLSQEIEINYTEPWLFDYPININLFIWQRKQDSTYVQRKYEAKMDYLANEEIKVGLIIGGESTIPSSAMDNPNISKSNSYIIGGTLNYDTRDDALSPQKGFIFNTSYRYYNKKIMRTKDVNLQKVEFNISYYLSILERQILALSIHARELKGGLIEQSDLYKMGGTFSLRGYFENQFLGNRILWANLEYRYLIERRSYVFLFYDEGYFQLQNAIVGKEKSISGFRSGFGAGINIETAIGILGVNFALAKGDSFSNGKIHFGVINEF